MNWRFAPDMSGEPAGWSEGAYASRAEATAAGQATFDGPIWVGWVVPLDYAGQLPGATQLVAEMKERAAERGADTSSFDALEDVEIETLEDLLGKTLRNWESWLVQRSPDKASSVVVVQDVRRVEP